MKIIAEVKTQSPFVQWKSERSWDELFEIAQDIGDIISIHTDPRWGGSFDLVTKASQSCKKPILAKGIHATDEEVEQALKAGADYVLVVGRICKLYREFCYHEPTSLEQLKTLRHTDWAVWNSRDLETGGLKTETFEQARAAFRGWLCQASNIHTLSDVHPKAQAVLVGTHLPEFAKSWKEKEEEETDNIGYGGWGHGYSGCDE